MPTRAGFGHILTKRSNCCSLAHAIRIRAEKSKIPEKTMESRCPAADCGSADYHRVKLSSKGFGIKVIELLCGFCTLV